MSEDFTTEKKRAAAWFRDLRDQIVVAFEGLEDSHATGPMADAAPARFDVSET
ncbi:MAG: coproporphyrinogen III oxidase, partial [Roseovarius sp.]|nr:coproporphyrinogen III oxidase [Roseovarius sp.]